jgi:threonine dehydratase
MTDPVLPTFEDIVAAADRLDGVARETPVLTHAALDEMSGGTLFVKAECLQVTGSFKIRGAMNRLAQLPDAQRAAGVVAFSSGNHAQGVARAARLLDMPALIVMPSDAPAIKVAGVEADGAEIVFYDRETESREEIVKRLPESAERSWCPVSTIPTSWPGRARQASNLPGRWPRRARLWTI